MAFMPAHKRRLTISEAANLPGQHLVDNRGNLIGMVKEVQVTGNRIAIILEAAWLRADAEADLDEMLRNPIFIPPIEAETEPTPYIRVVARNEQKSQ